MRLDKPLSRPTSGLSLIELLMALACVGILLTWGTSQYQAHLQRNQRAQARAQLLQTALWLERFASANGNYPLPQSIPSSVWFAPDLSYQLKVSSSTEGFTLMAIPTGKQLDDPCGTLTLSHTGVRAVQNADATANANQCWMR